MTSAPPPPDPYGPPPDPGPPPGSVPPAPPPGGYAMGGYPSPRTNGLAIASLVCSLAGLITLVSAPVGAVLGHVARRQIRERNEEGEGLALAGIIVGWTVTGIFLLMCCGVMVMAGWGASLGT